MVRTPVNSQSCANYLPSVLPKRLPYFSSQKARFLWTRAVVEMWGLCGGPAGPALALIKALSDCRQESGAGEGRAEMLPAELNHRITGGMARSQDKDLCVAKGPKLSVWPQQANSRQRDRSHKETSSDSMYQTL